MLSQTAMSSLIMYRMVRSDLLTELKVLVMCLLRIIVTEISLFMGLILCIRLCRIRMPFLLTERHMMVLKRLTLGSSTWLMVVLETLP